MSRFIESCMFCERGGNCIMQTSGSINCGACLQLQKPIVDGVYKYEDVVELLKLPTEELTEKANLLLNSITIKNEPL